ncbi:MAG: hypothetical protein QOJ94_2247 [Sphingomonadales bacterium]|jgi:hypothetical protein|nr:hypothetical protein [Sphingomonadales bacterium]
MYAKTTIPREFRDSRWIVRAKVITARDHWSDIEDSWTLYRIRVLRAYKGTPPPELRFFSFRDSGGFYLDRPWEGHDIGGEYLLFLNPARWYRGMPKAERGAVLANYACGQSQEWWKVSPSDRRLLDRLARRRR